MFLSVGTTIAGRYEIIDKIGMGGMSVVYKAKDIKLDRIVTVKVLKEELVADEDFKNRFKVEAKSAALLSHPNIVSVYDYGEENGIYYIIMEYIDGKTLKELIKEKAPFDNLTTLSIAAKIASALRHAHSKNIVHRDIKPQNILITKTGVVKVVDFGIAQAATSTTLKANETTMGSVYYFSPEQARGGFVNEKSDIYSLGITMFEMATGKVPYWGSNSISIAMQHINNPLPDIKELNPNVSRSVEGIIKKATRKNSDARYDSVDVLLSDIKLAIAELTSGKPSFEKDEEENTHKASRNNEENEIDLIPIRRKAMFADEENRMDFDRYQDKFKSQKKYNKKNAVKETEKVYDEDEEDDDEYEDNDDKKAVILAVITAIIIIIPLSIFGFKFLMGGNNYIMPNLVGAEFSDASSISRRYKFEIVKDGEDYSDNYDTGIIIEQSIEEGTKYEKNDTVSVIVSKGYKIHEMPDVENISEEEAKNELTGLIASADIEVVYEYDEVIPAGLVISQEPEVGKDFSRETKVKLTVSKGDQYKTVTVPNLVGKTEAEAKKMIDDLGLVLGEVSTAESSTAEKGYVIAQTVPEGGEISKNSIISIVVSSGNGEASNASAGSSTSSAQNTQQNTSSTAQDNNSVQRNEQKSVSVSVPAPDTSETSVDVQIIRIYENGQTDVVYDKTVNTSNFPFDVSVTGSGKAELQLYVDNAFVKSLDVDFS